MRKNVYYCDRCGCQLEDSGTKIVPHYFDFITEDLTVPINKDMENRHYCIDCTMEALEFLEPKKKPEKKLEENAQKNSFSFMAAFNSFATPTASGDGFNRLSVCDIIYETALIR